MNAPLESLIRLRERLARIGRTQTAFERRESDRPLTVPRPDRPENAARRFLREWSRHHGVELDANGVPH
jgi:hypothetical protein